MEEPTFYPATVRCAVVTGSSKGIGLEICRQLASKGITVILTARDEKKGSEAVADLNNCGLSNVVFHQLDVQDSSSISSLAKFIQTHFGILDILVNNAGVLGGTFDNDLPDDPDNPMKVTKQTFEEARECLDTNYYGLKRVTEALITLLKLSNSGNIVNVSSSAGKLKEMIFRGTDSTALLTEWTMAELVLNPSIQAKLQAELDCVVGNNRTATDSDVANLPYLQAVVKETLRVHPPGPLLSWARISTSDVQLSNGMVVPANTTAMVNMWSITHDPFIWAEPLEFKLERFLERQGGDNIDVRGNDLRLAPFDAGRKVCPGKNLGLVTVSLWVAKLVHHFKWVPADGKPVHLGELLKLSCEMATPLCAVAVPRTVPF